MIEQDLNDSFPEDQFTLWECPACGAQQQVMTRLLETVECIECEQGLMRGTDADWFDTLDPVEREVA